MTLMHESQTLQWPPPSITPFNVYRPVDINERVCVCVRDTVKAKPIWSELCICGAECDATPTSSLRQRTPKYTFIIASARETRCLSHRVRDCASVCVCVCVCASSDSDITCGWCACQRATMARASALAPTLIYVSHGARVRMSQRKTRSARHIIYY